MSTLPKSWILTTIDEIYSVIGGGTPSTNEPKYWNGEVPWITSADITENGKISPRKNVTENGIKNSATNLVPSNSLIVVTRIGLGKVALCEYSLCFSQDSQALFGNKDFIYPKYAFYFLLQTVKVFKYQNRGTTISGVTKKQLKDLPFKLPPYHEQKRIVAKIEELFTKLDAGIEALKQMRAQLKRYRQSVLKAAVEGRFTADWREQHKDELEPSDKLLERILKERREKWKAKQIAKYEAQGKTPPKNWQDKYKESKLPDTSNLSELSKGWVWAAAEQVCSSVRDGTHDTPKYVDEGVPLVTSKNLKTYGIDFSTTRNISYEDHKQISIRSGVEIGDVLYAMIGTIGNPIVVYTEDHFSIKNVGLFKKNEKAIIPEFLKYWLESIVLERLLIKMELIKGTTQKFIPLGHLRILPIPLPSLSEQKTIIEEISRLFSIIDESESMIENELKRAQSLRQSILKRAFEGKLVPQNPNDEPASVLLERIKAEKAKPKKSKQMEMF